MQVLALFGGKKMFQFPYQLVGWFVAFVPHNNLFKWVTVAHILAITCPFWNITARKKKKKT